MIKNSIKIKKQIINVFNFRRAIKEFDSRKKISKQDFNIILEAARLSPSSFGFEPWKLLILQNTNLREKIRPVCWGAQKQLPTASHFVVLLARVGEDMRYDAEYIRKTMNELHKSTPEVIATRTEKLKNFEENDFALSNNRLLFDWACMQTYIALGNMMTSAAFLGIDSCPIEGFNREQLEKILEESENLDREHFGVACMVAFGFRSQEPTKHNTRRSIDEITKWIV